MDRRTLLFAATLFLLGPRAVCAPVGCGTPNTTSTGEWLTTGPRSMGFVVEQGNSAVQAMSMNEISGGSADNWSASPLVGWLTLSGLSGAFPGALGDAGSAITIVTANTGSMTPGTYNGGIVITPSRFCTSTIFGPTTIMPVTLTITETPPPPPPRDIIPQIANSGTPESGGFFMIFNAVNVTSEPATVTVEFFDSQGAPMSMPTLGGEFVGFTATLQPGGYAAQATVPNGSGARIGYARITSTPNDSVAVHATFVQLVPGRPPFMAGIPATNTLHSTAYVPYVSDGGFTPSLALVSRVAQTVTLTAREGVEGAVRCSTTLSFGTDEHKAFVLRDVLPCTATGEGSLEIRGSSSTPALSGIGFLANDEGAFVTQPIWSSITNP